MSAHQVLAAARRTGHRLATAESCTGGLIVAALTEIAGASDVVIGGCVTYSNGAKQRLLGVSPETLARFGAVSEPVAQEMAQGALRALPEATLALSVTGIAGPGGSAHKPEGRVCFGLAWGGGFHVETQDFGALGRGRVRAVAQTHGLALLLRWIESGTA